jgi:hypothetical protein
MVFMRDGQIEEIIGKTVEMVNTLGYTVRSCSELYTRGHTNSRPSLNIPGDIVAIVFGRTPQLEQILESIGTTFWADTPDAFWNGGRRTADMMEAKVRMLVTVQGYEHFRTVLRQGLALQANWTSEIDGPVRNFHLPQALILVQALYSYLDTITKKMKDIDRFLKSLMVNIVLKREETGGWVTVLTKDWLKRATCQPEIFGNVNVKYE